VALYPWLVPRVVLPLHGRLTGRRCWSEYRRLRALQWESPETLEARSLAKLRALVGHAIVHVPFYRARFREVGVGPEALRSLDDLARLPITRKVDLRARPASHTTADNVPAARRQPTITSGSSGVPFRFFADLAGVDGVVAAYLLFLEWAGAALWQTRIDIGNSGDRPMPSAVPLPSRLERWARRMLLGEHVLALSGVDLSPEAFVACARAVSPRGYFIRGYTAYLARLAWRMAEAGIGLPVSPRVVMSGGETLSPRDAGVIGRAFGCPVVNQYAAWEVPHMAQTCPDNPAVLHVNSERVVLRVVGDDGRSLPPGTRGRIVVTALENYVMPFINYELGDAGVAGPPCACGRGFPTLLAVEGRLGEAILTPSGRLFSPATLDRVFRYCSEAVREYQAERTADDVLTVRIVPAARFRPETVATVRRELMDHVGSDMEVRIDVVAEIALEPSGKRFVIRPRGGELPASAPEAVAQHP
jgi:phenylacetate-coenzyme A ligase PaaK-like adenylate-forming protein